MHNLKIIVICQLISITVGVFLFSFLCVLGSCTFAAGAFLKGTSYLLPVMLLGRLLFGSGNGSLTSKQFFDLFIFNLIFKAHTSTCSRCLMTFEMA